MVSVLIDCQPSLWIKCQSVRAGLTILRDISAFVTAFLAKHCELSASLGRIFVDRVVVRVAEKEESAFAVPHRAFGELEPFREFEDFWIRRHDRVDRRIFAKHFDIHFARRDGDWHDTTFVELQLRLPHVDVIGRRIRERAVCPENRELNRLPRLYAAINDQPIRRIPTFHYRTATLTRRARQLAVDPDFGVIIDRRLENRGCSGKLHIVYTRGYGEVDPVPVETKPSGRASRFECRRIERYPS